MKQDKRTRRCSVWLKPDDSRDDISSGELCVALYMNPPFAWPVMAVRGANDELFYPIHRNSDFNVEQSQPDYVLALPELPKDEQR